MKKINLIIIVFCIGIISIFGINSKEYSISNISYTEGNSNLIGKEVSVRGIDEGTFHILSYDGEKVRLFSDFGTRGEFYNYGYDGNIPVSFENSRLYKQLMNYTENWKSQIEERGGSVSIFKVDSPTLEEILSVGHFVKNNDSELNYKYIQTDLTPEWIIPKRVSDNSYDLGNNPVYYTKTISDDMIYTVVFNDTNSETYIILQKPLLPLQSWFYGSETRVVLETSVYNLVSEDSEIKDYVMSLNKKDEELE